MDSFSRSEVAFWSSTTSAYVEIDIGGDFGFPQQSLITGSVDTVLIDPICRTVAIEGRDLSASLIDGYRQQDFVNQTASEVVAQVARSHNLIPMITPTSESVGRYYGDGYTRLSLGQFSRIRSDWDLVVELARENGFDAFVQGRMLFFQPANSSLSGLVHLALRDVQRMRIERSLTVSSGTTARVQSWDSRKVASYDSDNIATNSLPNSSIDRQSFLFSASNFTPSQVADSAERFATELRRLATVLHFEMPWDPRLAPRSQVFFDDLDMFLGTTFLVDSIETRYSSISGSARSVRAISI